MVSNPVYRSYIRYFSQSRLFIYESTVPEIAELAAIRQIIRMKSRKPKLKIVSSLYLEKIGFRYWSTDGNYNLTELEKSLILLGGNEFFSRRLRPKKYRGLIWLLGSLFFMESKLILTCSSYDYLDILVRSYSPKTVFTYAGGGVTGSVFVKNSRSRTKKEYYRIKNLTYYRKYL